MLKHVRRRQPLQLDTTPALARQERMEKDFEDDQLNKQDQVLKKDQFDNEDQMINEDRQFKKIIINDEVTTDKLSTKKNQIVNDDQLPPATLAPLAPQDQSQHEGSMDLDIEEQAQVMSGEEDDEDSIITNPPSILDLDGELLREAVEEEELAENEVAVLKGRVGRDSLVAAWVENGGRRGFARSYRSSSLSRGQRCFFVCFRFDIYNHFVPQLHKRPLEDDEHSSSTREEKGLGRLEEPGGRSRELWKKKELGLPQRSGGSAGQLGEKRGGDHEERCHASRRRGSYF